MKHGRIKSATFLPWVLLTLKHVFMTHIFTSAFIRVVQSWRGVIIHGKNVTLITWRDVSELEDVTAPAHPVVPLFSTVPLSPLTLSRPLTISSFLNSFLIVTLKPLCWCEVCLHQDLSSAVEYLQPPPFPFFYPVWPSADRVLFQMFFRCTLLACTVVCCLFSKYLETL